MYNVSLVNKIFYLVSTCKKKPNKQGHHIKLLIFSHPQCGTSVVLFLHFLCLQVRKEYGKCLRTHCCSGKSVETSISSSSKTTTSRTPGRYSTGSQVSLPACTPGRYSTVDSQVRPEQNIQAFWVISYHFQLSTNFEVVSTWTFFIGLLKSWHSVKTALLDHFDYLGKNPENYMTGRAWADPRQRTSAVYNKESIGSEM